MINTKGSTLERTASISQFIPIIKDMLIKTDGKDFNSKCRREYLYELYNDLNKDNKSEKF